MSSSIESYRRLEWHEIPTEEAGHRKAYISVGEVDNTKWVAKLSLPSDALFLMAEEIAYKISKVLPWNTIPKTKYLHQFADLNGKYAKYLHMINELLEFDKLPKGYTFQKFVNGCNAKQYRYSLYTNQSLPMPLSHMSYHRDFLLNVILGRNDAKPENTMLSFPQGKSTYSQGEFFEIDNEHIGSKYGYPYALANFSELYEARIDDYLLYEVLQVDIDKVLKIRDKYIGRTKEFVTSWNQNAKDTLNLEQECATCETSFVQIMQNIAVLKSSIQSLRGGRKEITPGILYQEYLCLMKAQESEECKS